MATGSPEQVSGGELVEGEELRQMSDHVLKEKIQRVQKAIAGGMAARLPDGGGKFDSLLRSCLRELDRRKAIPVTPAPPRPPPQSHHRSDDQRCDRMDQSRCAESSGLVGGTSANHQVTKSVFQSAFGMNEKAGDASSLEIIRSPDESRIFTENECKLCEDKEPSKSSSQSTKLSHKESSIDISANMEKISPDDDCKDIGPSCMADQAPPSTLSPKRKRAASVGCSMRLRSRKVQEVVLLDGDTHHSESAQETSNKRDVLKMYYPSREHPDSVELSLEDIKCLEPYSCLSSPIMNFYIQYLQGPIPSISRPRDEYYILNTYFYSKLEALTSKVDKTAYFMKLRRWWKGVNIFQKAYILLPVYSETHWSLVIICIPSKDDQSGPIILHLDSLKFHSSRSIFNVVEKFLKEEWSYLNENVLKEELPIEGLVWKNLPHKIEKKSIMVPQQENEYDCGLFVLYYTQRFIEEAPQRFCKKDLCMFGRKWFQPEEASALRLRIRDLLLHLFKDAELKKHKTDSTSEHSSEGS